MERLRPECTQEICDIRRPGRESGVNKQENDRKKKKKKATTHTRGHCINLDILF